MEDENSTREDENSNEGTWDILKDMFTPLVERVKNIPSRYLIGGTAAATLVVAAGAMFALRGDSSIEYATDYEFSQQTNEDHKADLERVVIHGRQFYVEKIEEQEGQLGFRFLPFEETSKVLSLDSDDFRLEAETKYAPERVQVEEFTEDRWADELDLTTSYSPQTNVGGLRAKILSQDELRRNAGAPENSQGFSGEDTAQYGIKTIKILGEEYFYPHVESSETGMGRNLNFYLVPVEGAKLRIRNSDGRITVINENRIYRPTISGTNLSLEESTGAGQAQTVTGS